MCQQQAIFNYTAFEHIRFVHQNSYCHIHITRTTFIHVIISVFPDIYWIRNSLRTKQILTYSSLYLLHLTWCLAPSGHFINVY